MTMTSTIARTLSAFMALALWAVALSAAAQAKLFSASSRAQGAPFDLVVTELRREADKSYISVPGFHGRSAPGSRWLMCAYTDLAIQRGFSHWAVMYPEQDKELLVVAFANSQASTPESLFGDEYRKDHVLAEHLVPVDRFAPFCGIRR